MAFSMMGSGFVYLLTAIALLFGLVIGSFLNVVVWRLPRGESIVSPPSSCPKCGNEIKWFDNVPVISWLVLRAKCRHCKAPISARYPLVEALTGFVFASITWLLVSRAQEWGDLAVLLPFLLLAAAGVALAFIDLDTHKLPNKIVLPAYPVIAVSLLIATWGAGWDWGTVARAAIGGAALYAFYFVLCIIGGMGFGDVKLAGVLGMSLAWLGWEYLVVGAFLPFLLGGLFSVALIVLRKAGRKSGIPFGPWMILGWYLALFIAEPVSSWYLNTLFS